MNNDRKTSITSAATRAQMALVGVWLASLAVQLIAVLCDRCAP